MVMTDCEPCTIWPSAQVEERAEHPRAAVLEVAQLLREARVHVVEVRDAQPLRQPHADQAHLLVRVDGVVAFAPRAAGDGDEHQTVEQDLGDRRADAHPGDEGGPPGPEDAEVGDVHVPADGISDQVDVVPQLGQGLEAVILAEGSAAGLEERLRRQHQDAHRPL
jgi:hypothetical protein